jgi:type II secretory ATPase GspE/PulE/Tfp pilus assembly ATPase PilB-like protein
MFLLETQPKENIMKKLEYLKGTVPSIVNQIIAGGISRNNFTIRLKHSRKCLRIFEKGGLEVYAPMTEAVRVQSRLGLPVMLRLKKMAGLETADFRNSRHGVVQVGDYRFKVMPGIYQKIKIIALPAIKGNEELVIDLVPL